MKRFVTLFFFVLLCTLQVLAQTTTIDVVALKNGSVIKGTITEQIPNESLKIQTGDGSTFVYRMDEVEKITKETVDAKKSLRKQLLEESKKDMKDAVLSKGYKAFINIDYVFNSGDFKDYATVGVSTTHGYQINPYIFAGAGVGFNILYYMKDGGVDPKIGVPIYFDARITPLKNYITPFIDVRIGQSVADIEGFYFSPNIGCRIGIRNRSAVGIMLGYHLQQMDGIKDTKIGDDGQVYVKKGKLDCKGFAFRVCWEF